MADEATTFVPYKSAHSASCSPRSAQRVAPYAVHPAGVLPGAMLQVQGPSGMMQVQLPPDVGAGMPFTFMAPAGGSAGKIIDFMKERCPEAKLEELEPPSVTFTVPTAASTLSSLFGHLSEAQAALGVSECSVTQCTLEQIFILMASKSSLRKQGSTSQGAPEP